MSLHLRSCAGVGKGGVVGEVLVEGTHAVLQEKVVGVEEADSQGKVSFNGTRLQRSEDEGREGGREGVSEQVSDRVSE